MPCDITAPTAGLLDCMHLFRINGRVRLTACTNRVAVKRAAALRIAACHVQVRRK